MWTKVPPSGFGFGIALTLIAGLGAATPGHAAPCAGLPNPVVVTGSASAEPLLTKIANLLQRDAKEPQHLTVIWKLTTSCDGVESVALDKNTVCAPGACVKGVAKFWTLDPLDTSPKTCDLDAAGTHVDLAISDVLPVTCPTFSLQDPSDVMHMAGPIIPYALTMSKQASEGAIQAEEANYVFSKGQTANVRPWLKDSTLFLFDGNDAGRLLVGLRSGLDKTSAWHTSGLTLTTPDEVILNLQSDPASALAILPTTLTDSRRGEVRTLAFQAIGQHGAFFPDRKAATFEKQNVRDGHYPLWGYLRTVLRRDPVNMSQPKSQNGYRLAQILLGNTQVATQDVMPMHVKAGMVPQCAMRVSRAADGGPMAPFSHPESCHCWFEKNVTNGLLGCMECSPGMTCATGTCRRGFCEVQ